MKDELTWRKSNYSPQGGNSCVEVANLDTGQALRDSKNPGGPVLTFPAAEWAAFTTGVRAGQFRC